MDYTMWSNFILKKDVSLGFRLGTTLTEGRWGDRITLKIPFNLKLCDLCPLQRKQVADKFFKMTEVAELLGHSGENHKDIAISNTQ